MQIFSVSQFLEFLNTALASAVFPEGAVIEGEVAEYRVSQNKWIWFLLKDEQSVVSCFSTVWQLRAPLEDGMKIRVFGVPKVHAKSGKFAVNVERVEFIGEGALRRAFELLKKKLADEGLFAAERKRPIPRFPERIGLIASHESAAYTDFLRILKNRWGGMEIALAHVQVQGRDAIRDITAAFGYFNAHQELADVLVLTRGGGSLEDLQAFNSEEVTRSIFASKIPVVVGVGHERDETLADYAADVRASTPTNAAELIAPDRRDVAAAIDSGASRMFSEMRGALALNDAAVTAFSEQIESHARRAMADFSHLMKDFFRRAAAFIGSVSASRSAVAAQISRLMAAAGFWTDRAARDIISKERLMAGLDPRRVLARGYAVVRRAERGSWRRPASRRGGKIIKDAAQVDAGERLDVQLHRGSLVTEVRERLL